MRGSSAVRQGHRIAGMFLAALVGTSFGGPMSLQAEGEPSGHEAGGVSHIMAPSEGAAHDMVHRSPEWAEKLKGQTIVEDAMEGHAERTSMVE